MGWTNDTYTGLRMTGQPSNYRYAMFELARALNERESAVLIDPTVFIKANDTQGSHVSFSEFENLHIPDYCTNMQRIQSGLSSLVDGGQDDVQFKTAPGGAAYTLETLGTAIGGDLTTPIARANDTQFLQNMQSAFALLIYPTVGNPSFLSGSGAYEVYHGTGATRQLAWDNLSGLGPSTDQTGARRVFYQSGDNFIVDYYAIRSERVKGLTIDCTAYDNGIDVTGGRYTIQVDNQCNKGIELVISSGVGDSTEIAPQGFEGIVQIEMAQPDCTTSSTSSVEFGFSALETTVPFSTSTVSEFIATGGMEIDFDISPILTDKAAT